MTTPLLRKAYQLNQEINDRTISFPLRYDRTLNKWKFQFHERYTRRFRIHLLIYVYQGISTILFGVALLYSMAYLRGVLKTFQILAGSLLFLTTFNGFVVDVILVVYGNNIAACINALFELPSTWPKRELSSKRKRESNGVLALCIVVGGIIGGFFMPALVVYKNMDPIYTLFVIAKNIEWFRFFKIIDTSCWVVVFLRYILSTISVLVFLVSLRALILVNLGTNPVLISLFRILSSLRLEKQSLKYYLQICILFNSTKEVFKIFNFSVLSSVFFVVVLGANGMILFANLRKFLLSFLCGVYTLFILVCIILLFNISDKIYSNTKELLIKWEKVKLFIKSSDHLFIKKTVKSFWPMVVPLGTVGAVDKHTRNAYLEEVLNYAFNLLVIVNEA